MARREGAVRDVEAAIEPRDGVGVDHDDFNDEVETVKAHFGVIPGRVGQRSWGGEVDSQAEASAKSEQERGEQQEGDLGAVAALTELFGAS